MKKNMGAKGAKASSGKKTSVGGKTAAGKASTQKAAKGKKTPAAKKAPVSKKVVAAKKGARAPAKLAGSATKGRKSAAPKATKKKALPAKKAAVAKKAPTTRKSSKVAGMATRVPVEGAGSHAPHGSGARRAAKVAGSALKGATTAAAKAGGKKTSAIRKASVSKNAAKKASKKAPRAAAKSGRAAVKPTGSAAKVSKTAGVKTAPKQAAVVKRGDSAATRLSGKKPSPGSRKRRQAAKRPPTIAGHKTPASKVPFEAYKGTKPYIFVSYSHQNMPEVFGIIKKLSDSRYRLWYDEGIEPGNEWPEVVGKALLGSSQLLVFMSRAAAVSRNVRNEVNLAFSEDKNIMVVYLEKTSLTEGMKLQIGAVQFLNRFEMSGREFVDKLKSVLGNDLHN